MVGRILGTIIVLALAAALAVLAWPQLLGLEQTPVIAQLVAMRGAATVVAAAGVLLFGLVAVLWRQARRFLAGIALVLLVFAGANAVILGTRGIFGQEAVEPAPGTVTVLAWNTLGETPSAEDVADLIAETAPDVVSLPETTYERGAQLVAMLATRGLLFQQFTFAYDTIAKSNSTTLLVAESLGEYVADTSTPTTAKRPSLVARPAGGVGPTIVAAHAAAPDLEDLEPWRADQRWLAAACADPSVIVAGDLNSTVDHWAGLVDPAVPGAAIGGCADAASVAGAAGIGTWPVAVPTLLGSPIDHVLVGSEWSVEGFRVIGTEDGSGADHRPVLASLVPATSAG